MLTIKDTYEKPGQRSKLFQPLMTSNWHGAWQCDYGDYLYATACVSPFKIKPSPYESQPTSQPWPIDRPWSANTSEQGRTAANCTQRTCDPVRGRPLSMSTTLWQSLLELTIDCSGDMGLGIGWEHRMARGYSIEKRKRSVAVSRDDCSSASNSIRRNSRRSLGQKSPDCDATGTQHEQICP